MLKIYVWPLVASVLQAPKWKDGVYEAYILWKAIELNKQSWSVYSVGKLYKFISTHKSRRGDKKNCRTLNQYRLSFCNGGHLKWGWLGQSKHPHPLFLSFSICSGICFQWTLMQLQVPRVSGIKHKTEMIGLFFTVTLPAVSPPDHHCSVVFTWTCAEPETAPRR